MAEKELRRGVVLHAGAIGDCLLTIPLASCLKETCSLDWLEFIGPAEYISFYPGRTCIDAIRPIEGIALHRLFETESDFVLEDNDPLLKLFNRYEQVVSLIGFGHPSFEKNLLFTVHCCRSAEVTLIDAKSPADAKLHVSNLYLNSFKQQQQSEQTVPPDTVSICPLPEDYQAGGDMLERSGIDPDRKIVLIHPGSGSRQKCWHWHNFLQTAFDLKANGLQPVFLLGPAELERFEDAAIQAIRQYHVLENLSLTQVLQVLSQTDAFLGNDSGIGHMAAGMGKKTLILFGPSDPVQYAQQGQNVRIERLTAETFVQPDTLAQAAMTKTLLEML
ncbi:MAG: glycosyltransferase family 9 protein [Planctomycetes bacterium]|nr:glycosyltransferase family 9 protein [Planctomycetota bacterium]